MWGKPRWVHDLLISVNYAGPDRRTDLLRHCSPSPDECLIPPAYPFSLPF